LDKVSIDERHLSHSNISNIIFFVVASTAAGVAVGHSIGHAIVSFFMFCNTMAMLSLV
jgi:hypothetical protein